MSALDIGKQSELLSLIVKLKKSGKTIILTSHNPNHALAIKNECEVCLIHNGEIMGCGNSLDVLSQKNITALFGNGVTFDKDNCAINFKVD